MFRPESTPKAGPRDQLMSLIQWSPCPVALLDGGDSDRLCAVYYSSHASTQNTMEMISNFTELY